MIEGFRRRATRRSVTGIAAIAACVALAAAAATAALADPPPALFAGGKHGIVFAHGQQGKPRRGSPQLVYHNGPVMTSGATVTSIFWGTSWSTSTTNPGDKIAGIDTFYAGFGGSTYAATNTEYTNASGVKVGSAVVAGGHVVDSLAAPTGAPSTSQVLAVVAAKITPDPSGNGYYPVYSDQKRGNAGYCAWHSWGTINNVPVQFAFFFNLDNDPGCDPRDTSTGHGQGLAALGNVSGHELSEALTDPHIDAWYDNSGNENADKCAWNFGSSPVTFSDGTRWKIQGNWSNAAYTAGLSYLGSGSGCIDGTN